MRNFTRSLVAVAVLFVAANVCYAQQELGRIIVMRNSTTVNQEFAKFLPEWLAPMRFGNGKGAHTLYRVRSDTLTTQKLLKVIKKVPDVVVAFPDSIGRIHRQPSSESASTQEGAIATAGWFLGAQPYLTVGADVARAFMVSRPISTRRTICVIGTGLDTSIEVFQVHRPSNGVWGHNLIGDPNDLTDTLDHETRVVSQISMVTSADPAIAVYAIKMINDEGFGYVSDVIKALQFVIDEKSRFVETRGAAGIDFSGITLSLSFAGTGSDMIILRDKLEETENLGVFLAIASGDHADAQSQAPNLDESPGANGLASGARCLGGSIAVAAASADGSQLSDSSFYGPATVQFAAPGSGNRAVGVGGVVTSFTGTSAALGFVAGAGVELMLRRHLSLGYAIVQISISARPQPAYGGRIQFNRLLDFGKAFDVPLLAIDPPFFLELGKLKYSTEQNQIHLSGISDGTACVQGYSGFVLRDERALFDARLTGSPPLANKLAVYNKTGGRRIKKVVVK